MINGNNNDKVQQSIRKKAKRLREKCPNTGK